jgi:hypothetical protein
MSCRPDPRDVRAVLRRRQGQDERPCGPTLTAPARVAVKDWQGRDGGTAPGTNKGTGP